MKRALTLVAVVASACDLDLFGAYGEYCTEHGGCDGGAAGGSVSAGGGTGGATGGGSGGATGGGSAGGATGGGSAGDAGVTLDVWCERYAQAQCDRVTRCLNFGAAFCFDQYYGFCDRSDRPRARAGSTRYEQPAAEACLQRIASDQCTNVPPTCSGIFVPNAQLGEKCEQGDCVAGYCSELARFTSSATCPVCKAFKQLGEECGTVPGDQRICAAPSSCFSPGDGGTSSCQAPLPDGTPCSTTLPCSSGVCTDYSLVDGGVPRCGPPPLGSTCSPFLGCGPAAYCRGARSDGLGGGTDGVCTARIPLGQPCVQEQLDEGCEGGGSCVGTTCQLLLGTQPPGAPCDRSQQCARNRCSREDFVAFYDDGGVWIGDGTCLPQFDAGHACTINSSDCYPGLYCQGDGGCARTLPLSAACSNFVTGACGANTCLAPADGGTPRCTGLVAPGAPCTGGICPQFQTCASFDGGVPFCQLTPTGQTCMGPPRCESFHCIVTTPSVCAASCF